MTTQVTLYHFPPSLASQKIRLVLAEKQIAYTSRMVNIGPRMENYEPWYTRLNPGLVVPTLVIDGDVLVESAHIAAEIDRRFSAPSLSSNDPEVGRLIELQDGIKMREFGYGQHKGFIGFLTKGAFAKRLDVLRSQQQKNPDSADVYQKRIEDVLAWQDISSNEQTIADLKTSFNEMLDQIERQLRDREFLTGDKYSLADVFWTVVLARFKMMNLALGKGESRKNMTAYYERVRARPSFKAANVWEHLKPDQMLPILWDVILFRMGMR